MATTDRVDPEVLLSTIDAAVEALLRVRLALAPVENVDVPVDALDGALRADHGHGVARRDFGVAVSSLGALASRDDRPLLLAVEAAGNELAARAADVAYRLGVGHRAPARG